jgi:hypothetical protein
MTALDVCHLLYSPRSLTRVRSILRDLSGGGDFVNNQYLYRFKMPDIGEGNPERIYTLGSRGRDLLVSQFGMSVDWHFRPGKPGPMNYSQLMHNLVLTRFLVAAVWWIRGHPNFKLADVRICYELAGKAGSVAVGEGGKKENVSVVPDAWLLVERFQARVFEEALPVLLEIDRGTMYRERFKRHVLGRIEFVRSGGYKTMFGTEGVRIAYATTGVRAGEGQGRRKAMLEWTKECLRELGLANWAPVFRFCALSFGELYESGIFDKPVWFRPDREKPVGLFEG